MDSTLASDQSYCLWQSTSHMDTQTNFSWHWVGRCGRKGDMGGLTKIEIGTSKRGFTSETSKHVQRLHKSDSTRVTWMTEDSNALLAHVAKQTSFHTIPSHLNTHTQHDSYGVGAKQARKTSTERPALAKTAHARTIEMLATWQPSQSRCKQGLTCHAHSTAAWHVGTSHLCHQHATAQLISERKAAHKASDC